MKNETKDVANSSTTVAEKTAKTAKTKKVKKPNKFVKYFKDLKAEVKKVVWPTKKTVLNNTGVVLVVMIICGIFVWGMDTGFKFLIDLALNR